MTNVKQFIQSLFTKKDLVKTNEIQISSKSSDSKTYLRPEEIPDEIKSLQKRLSYLRNRKKQLELGEKPSKFRKDGKLKVNYDPLYSFYRSWIKSGSWKSRFEQRQKHYFYQAKLFVEYQEDLYNSVKRYGNQEQKEEILKFLGAQQASPDQQN